MTPYVRWKREQGFVATDRVPLPEDPRFARAFDTVQREVTRTGTFFLALFGRLHIDTVVSGFEKLVTRLEQSVAYHVAQERAHAKRELDALVAKERAIEAKVRANETVQRIRALIGK